MRQTEVKEVQEESKVTIPTWGINGIWHKFEMQNVVDNFIRSPAK
jgi:hypothetical protein